MQKGKGMDKLYNVNNGSMTSNIDRAQSRSVFRHSIRMMSMMIVLLLIVFFSLSPKPSFAGECKSFTERIYEYIPKPVRSILDLETDMEKGKKEIEKHLKNDNEKALSQKNFEQVKGGVKVLKEKYNETAQMVEGVGEYFDQLKESTEKWRKATRDSHQIEALETISDLDKKTHLKKIIRFFNENKKFKKYLPKKLQEIVSTENFDVGNYRFVYKFMGQLNRLDKELYEKGVYSTIDETR